MEKLEETKLFDFKFSLEETLTELDKVKLKSPDEF